MITAPAAQRISSIRRANDAEMARADICALLVIDHSGSRRARAINDVVAKRLTRAFGEGHQIGLTSCIGDFGACAAMLCRHAAHFVFLSKEQAVEDMCV